MTGVRCINEEHRKEVLDADAYVLALGSYSPFLLKPLGVPCLIYPAKGYSATIAIDDHRGAPTVSLTDLAWKIVFTRLGDRLRVAGTAELSGYNKDLNLVRCEALIRRTFELFPDAGRSRQRAVLDGTAPGHAVERSAGRRSTRYRNLFLDTGHGTLGWTMACGSGPGARRRDRRPQAWCRFCFCHGLIHPLSRGLVAARFRKFPAPEAIAQEKCREPLVIESLEGLGHPSDRQRVDRAHDHRADAGALVSGSLLRRAMGGKTLLLIVVGVDVVHRAADHAHHLRPEKEEPEVRPGGHRRAASCRARLRVLRDVRCASGLQRLRRRPLRSDRGQPDLRRKRSQGQRRNSSRCRSPGPA